MGCTIRRPMIRETTALGAAYLAGLATKTLPSRQYCTLPSRPIAMVVRRPFWL